jgi:hypothetical protein
VGTFLYCSLGSLSEWMTPRWVKVPNLVRARTSGQRSVAQNGQYSAPM